MYSVLYVGYAFVVSVDHSVTVQASFLDALICTCKQLFGCRV